VISLSGRSHSASTMLFAGCCRAILGRTSPLRRIAHLAIAESARRYASAAKSRSSIRSPISKHPVGRRRFMKHSWRANAVTRWLPLLVARIAPARADIDGVAARGSKLGWPRQL